MLGPRAFWRPPRWCQDMLQLCEDRDFQKTEAQSHLCRRFPTVESRRRGMESNASSRVGCLPGLGSFLRLFPPGGAGGFLFEPHLLPQNKLGGKANCPRGCPFEYFLLLW